MEAPQHDELATINRGSSGMAQKGVRATSVRLSTKPVSKLWRVHGRFFDVESYVAKHPGGALIRLGQGQDCTALWESVHALSDVPRRVLDHFEVRVEETTARYVPLYTWDDDGFYRTVSRRVRAYFTSNRLSPKAPATYYVTWAAMMAAWLLGVYFGFWRGVLPMAALAGMALQMLDHAVTHDGSHAAISKNALLNRLAAHTLHLYFWATPVWAQHHVVAHHSHTGVEDYDPDLRNNPLQRKSTGDPLRPWHRAQQWFTWLYLPWAMSPLQSLMYLTAVFGNQRIFGVPFKMSAADWLRALLGWSFALGVLVLGPLSVRPWTSVLLTLAVYWGAQSFLYFLTVVPNHDCLRTLKNSSSSMSAADLERQPMDWGEKQVRSTADFVIWSERLSHWVNPWLGGIHYQIEHHLFPSVSHCHYPKLAPIVERTCREFGIPYERRSWLSTLQSFQQALAFLSRKTLVNANEAAAASTERGTVG